MEQPYYSPDARLTGSKRGRGDSSSRPTSQAASESVATGARSVLSPAAVTTARDKLPRLWALMDMSDVKFKKYLKTSEPQTLHAVLGVRECDVVKRSNTYPGLDNLRNLFDHSRYPWISRDSDIVARFLLDAKVVCGSCYSASSAFAAMDMNQSVLKRHEESKAHKRNVAKGVQLSARESFTRHKTAQQLKEDSQVLAVAQ